MSRLVTAYDHYVNIPMSTTKGDFSEPATMLFYSERTPDYDGAPVEGVDMIVETTGDFVSAVFRVMPHAAEPERMERNLAAMRSVDVEPLSEFLGRGDKEPHVRSWGSPRGISRNLDLREDGAPMNAMHDYEIVMTAEELPPVNAFWSATLYENETGFFIPNDRFKYSVGENAGFKPGEDGGIRIVIAAEQPEGVPEENWLPINQDMDLDIIMRLCAPDLERYTNWAAPKAKKLDSN